MIKKAINIVIFKDLLSWEFLPRVILEVLILENGGILEVFRRYFGGKNQ